MLLELVLLAGITLAAFELRAQHLSDIPRFADEINEIVPSFDIARGNSFPLTSGPKHIGAFFDYLLAGAMLVFGRTPDLPRQVVLVSGMATVLLTYGYARFLGGRSAALLAAGLLVVSAPHVLLSSRVAWSVSLVPLLCIGAAWALELAVSRRKAGYLLATGLLAGLALQAHPSFVTLLPGLAIFGLLRGRLLLRSPYTYLAGVVFILACANILVYNWQSGSGGARSVAREYPGKTIGLSAYVSNAAAPLHGLALTVSSAVDPILEPSVLEPFIVLVTSLSLLSLLYVGRHRSLLPPLVVLSAMVLLPLIHHEFDPLLKARYIMPLVPLVYVAMGVAGADLLHAGISARFSALPLTLRRRAVIGVWIAIMGGMLTSLLQFESAAIAMHCTNAPQRAFVDDLERHRFPGEWVLLDGGSVRSAERMGYLTLLELSGKKVGETTLGRGGVWKELQERPTFLTAVDDGKAVAVFEKQGLPLIEQAILSVHPGRRESTADGKQPQQGIGLYRVSREGATLLAHNARPGCGGSRLN